MGMNGICSCDLLERMQLGAWLIYLVNFVIFHSFVSLPEGTYVIYIYIYYIFQKICQKLFQNNLSITRSIRSFFHWEIW